SVLSADFAHLADQVALVCPYVDVLHLDVMDGHFVPNLTMGLPVVASLRRATDMPLHVHLMITNPEDFAVRFAEAGADLVCFHAEAHPDPRRLAAQLHATGTRAGLALRPGTALAEVSELLDEFDLLLVMTVEPGFGGQQFMYEMLPKIAEARGEIESRGSKMWLEVDGGVGPATIRDVVGAGADTLIVGSAIFGQPDVGAAAKALRDAISRADGRPLEGPWSR
ncbi:MAG: ribulose-phosphate 3-epimerase, partial [Actinomycetota bacterium]